MRGLKAAVEQFNGHEGDKDVALRDGLTFTRFNVAPGRKIKIIEGRATTAIVADNNDTLFMGATIEKLSVGTGVNYFKWQARLTMAGDDREIRLTIR